MAMLYQSPIFFDPEAVGGAGAWRHEIQQYVDMRYVGGEIETGPDGTPLETVLEVFVSDESFATLPPPIDESKRVHINIAWPDLLKLMTP